VRLRVTAGKLDIHSEGVSFHLYDGINILTCTVAGEVLLDLADYHSLHGTQLEIFGLLLPEIERLASAKYRFPQPEETGALVITRMDLLRYGFSGQFKSDERQTIALRIAAE
jgi:hypothetical protein